MPLINRSRTTLMLGIGTPPLRLIERQANVFQCKGKRKFARRVLSFRNLAAVDLVEPTAVHGVGQIMSTLGSRPRLRPSVEFH
jgi:hypothetical protein